jgi:predicted RNA-binding Zn ribbon-like protein
VSSAAPRITDAKLLGGALCLDFANTVDYRLTERHYDWLSSYTALIQWSDHAGILEEGAARELFEAAGRHPEAAAAVLARALELREAIFRVFAAIAHGQPSAVDDLDALSGAWAEARPHARLRDTATGFDWRWPEDAVALDRPLWPVAQSAVALLTTQDLTRVKMCASTDGCGWLFLDTTRNRSRQWCDIATCGNRARARRHYARTKGRRG